MLALDHQYSLFCCHYCCCDGCSAESCARTSVKLDEMTRLLEKLALDKVAEGDEAGAREVLKVGGRFLARACERYAHLLQ